MSIIKTMCDVIWNCFSSIYSGIKYLLGYQTEEGYQLIESPKNTNSHAEQTSKSLSLNSRGAEGKSVPENKIKIRPIDEMEIYTESHRKETKVSPLISEHDSKKSSQENLQNITSNNAVLISQSVTSTEISDSGTLIKFDQEKNYKVSDDDISKMNFFKAESVVGSAVKNEENTSDAYKTQDTIVPQNITEVLQKTPEVSETSDKTIAAETVTKEKKTSVELQKVTSEKLPLTETKPTVSKSTSIKISGLAGKLGNINFAPPGGMMMGRPPKSKPPTSSEKQEEKELTTETDDSQTIPSVSKILKERSKTANKKRRPPSKSFLNKTLKKENEDNEEGEILEDQSINESNDEKSKDEISDKHTENNLNLSTEIQIPMSSRSSSNDVSGEELPQKIQIDSNLKADNLKEDNDQRSHESLDDKSRESDSSEKLSEQKLELSADSQVSLNQSVSNENLNEDQTPKVEIFNDTKSDQSVPISPQNEKLKDDISEKSSENILNLSSGSQISVNSEKLNNEVLEDEISNKGDDQENEAIAYQHLPESTQSDKINEEISEKVAEKPLDLSVDSQASKDLDSSQSVSKEDVSEDTEKKSENNENHNTMEPHEVSEPPTNPHTSLESLPKLDIKESDFSYDASESASVHQSQEDLKSMGTSDSKNNTERKYSSEDMVAQEKIDEKLASYAIPEDDFTSTEFKSDPDFNRMKNTGPAEPKEQNFKTPFVTVTGDEFVSAEDFSKRETEKSE